MPGAPLRRRLVGRRPGTAGPRRWLRRAAVASVASMGVLAAAAGGPGTAGPPSGGPARSVPAGTAASSLHRTGDQRAGGPPSSAHLTGSSASGGLVAVGAPAALPAGATAVGPLPPATPLQLLVVLRPRHATALDRFVRAVSDPSSPGYGHYLAPGTFDGRYGPAPRTAQSARAGLSSLGLRVGCHHGRRAAGGGLRHRRPGVDGAARGVRAVPPGDRADGLRQRSAPRLPRSVAAGVAAVSGLSDTARAVPLLAAPTTTTSTGRRAASGRAASGRAASGRAESPAGGTGGPSPCTAASTAAADEGAYTWNQLATAYGFTTAYGAGDSGRARPSASSSWSPTAART